MRSYYNDDNVLGEHGCNIAERIRKFIEETYRAESENGYSVRELTGIIVQEVTICESHRVLVNRMSGYRGKIRQPDRHELTKNQEDSPSRFTGAKVIPLNPKNRSET